MGEPLLREEQESGKGRDLENGGEAQYKKFLKLCKGFQKLKPIWSIYDLLCRIESNILGCQGCPIGRVI